MSSLISWFGRTRARMNWFVGLVSPSGDHGFGVLHDFRGWLVGVVGHAKFDYMFWSHPGPDELVCQFGQSIRGSRFWCFAWFLWLVGWGGWTCQV